MIFGIFLSTAGASMSVYWLSWGLSRSAAPLIGGWLNDTFSPRLIWIGGLLIGLTSTLGLAFLAHQQQKSMAVNLVGRQQ
jgi:MFS family permease